MLLAVDIGNTNVTMGIYDKENLLFTVRLATEVRYTSDQYAVDIQNALSLHGTKKSVDAAIIASVVPAVGQSIKIAIRLLYGIDATVLGPGVKTGLNIKIDNPAQLGADLAAGAVGALKKYKMPCIIIDMGTASTISVLDKNGYFRGGAIAAGVRLTLKALTENTAQLPAVHIEAPGNIIGTNTVDCMKCGLVIGTAAMLDGLIARMEEELGEQATVVATGGLSREIICHCKRDGIVYDENLLLDGLRLIEEKNRS